MPQIDSPINDDDSEQTEEYNWFYQPSMASQNKKTMLRVLLPTMYIV
jgi:hypothetical protein